MPVALARADALDEGDRRARCGRRALLGRRRADRTRRRCSCSSDDNASVPNRTARAGRIRDEDGLTPTRVGRASPRAPSASPRAVRDATGLRTVFHHHCAGYVETPQEIDALMSRTDPALLGLCLDTGHLTFGGGDPRRRARARTAIASGTCTSRTAIRRWRAQARAEGWDYHDGGAPRHLLRARSRDRCRFASVLDALRVEHYAGWIVVEQDVLPGLGTPAASAARNREYLRRPGL